MTNVAHVDILLTVLKFWNRVFLTLLKLENMKETEAYLERRNESSLIPTHDCILDHLFDNNNSSTGFQANPMVLRRYVLPLSCR